MSAADGHSLSTNLDVPARALAIGAHPDDVEFGCGGTLAKWAAAGCEIFHLICTDGSKGSWDPTQNPADLVTTRQREQQAAADRLGAREEVVFLGWRDGELESGLRQRSDTCHWIRKIRPDVVLGHDPWKRYRLHPDHRNAGLLAVEGIVAARDPHFFPEQSQPPHRPSALLLWEADEVDHVEDITEWIDVKLAALLEHRSQFRSTMAVDDGGAEDELEAFRERVRGRAAEASAGAEGIVYAEAFKLLRRL